jgi:hypothetical protein
MEIRSPIGELPFAITDVRIRAEGLCIHGTMGAWPTEVEVHWSDLPALAPLLLRAASPYLSIAAGLTLAATVVARRRP